MNISTRLENYLNLSNALYDVIHHSHTTNSLDSALTAHVPINRLVKAVILKDKYDDKFVMALVPADHNVQLQWANNILNRHFGFASEEQISDLFPDCEVGAIPGFGQAFDMELMWDDLLLNQSSLFFEAGNHQDLIEIDDIQFEVMFSHQPHGRISRQKLVELDQHMENQSIH